MTLGSMYIPYIERHGVLESGVRLQRLSEGVEACRCFQNNTLVTAQALCHGWQGCIAVKLKSRCEGKAQLLLPRPPESGAPAQIP